MEREERFNEMQTVKRRMYAMRNGVIADTLRKAGSPFSVIFGLNLPQLVEIATEIGKDREMATRLWANSTTRESMLLAPMLMPADDFSIEEAIEWCRAIPSFEVADILCHRLLRHEPYAPELVRKLIAFDDPMMHYTGVRLMCNIASRYPDEARRIGEAELDRDMPATRQMASMLLDF